MAFGTQVVGRVWDWQRHRPSQADPRPTGMTRAEARHWRQAARVAAATTPAEKLSAAWQMLSANVHGHPMAQEYVADVLVTLATATAVAVRTTDTATEWQLNDALGAATNVPAGAHE